LQLTASAPETVFPVLSLMSQCHAEVQSPGLGQKLPQNCHVALSVAPPDSHPVSVQGVMILAYGDGDEVHSPVWEGVVYPVAVHVGVPGDFRQAHAK
jgi:hypothetical protein